MKTVEERWDFSDFEIIISPMTAVDRLLRCPSSVCLRDWSVLCCGVKAPLGQTLFSGRGSSFASEDLWCTFVLIRSFTLYKFLIFLCVSPPPLFFWHENPELHLS